MKQHYGFGVSIVRKYLGSVSNLTCPECSKPMYLRESKFGPFYGCSMYPQCKGTHGARPDGSPLGKPADQETRQYRILAHAALDRLWEPGPCQLFGSRATAYEWVQKAMHMSPADAHIANFTKEDCQQIIEALWAYEDAKS